MVGAEPRFFLLVTNLLRLVSLYLYLVVCTIEIQNSDVVSQIRWILVINEFKLRPNSTNKKKKVQQQPHFMFRAFWQCEFGTTHTHTDTHTHTHRTNHSTYRPTSRTRDCPSKWGAPGANTQRRTPYLHTPGGP